MFGTLIGFANSVSMSVNGFVHSPALGRNNTYSLPSLLLTPRSGSITEYAQDSINLNQLQSLMACAMYDIGILLFLSL